MLGLKAAWSAQRRWHRWVAHWPRPLAKGYLSLAGAVARLTPFNCGAWICNAVLGAGDFPGDLRFGPRRVTVGQGSPIRLIPHPGEFDALCLFTRRLDYEFETFAWLEAAARQYDVVVEIGANIGVFTVFLEQLSRTGAGPPRIYAFEPAAEPYRRLQANLAANRATHVSAYPAAVGDGSGFRDFYEPAGHLTNGSFVRDFAAIFSDDVRETKVMTCLGSDLCALVQPGERVLLKIDVEGYEPVLLKALQPFIAASAPDILIEVLTQTEAAIAGFAKAGDYRCAQLGEAGLEPRPAVYADPDRRDWLLQPGSEGLAAAVNTAAAAVD